MTDAPFRWGLLGAARIARALIPAIREAGGVVAALGVRDPGSARAQAFAQEWGVPLVGGYADLIAADVDGVYNPLPNDAHRPWSLAALRAGRAVLTEKPLTLNAAEAQELADAAAQTGGTLLEAFAYRFQPHVTRIVELVRGGTLGEIRSVHGAFGFHLTNPDDFRWNAAQGGGALYDVGTYPVNLMRLLLGEPQAVTAQARWTGAGPQEGEGGVDLALSGTLEFSGPFGSGGPGQGVLATLDCAFDWTEPSTQRLSVVGSRGTLDVPGAYHSHTHGPVTLQLNVEGQTRQEVFPPSNGYARMVAHVQRLARGQEEALYPPADAVAQARVLDALLASARTGRRVTLDGRT